MNECREGARLSAYHDGELWGAARAGMAEHLRQCPACAAELSRLRALSRMLAAVAEPEAPPAATRRFHKAVDAVPMLELAHIAEVFGAVAASILVACCLWLLHARSAGVTSDQIPIWETVAVARHETPATAPEEQLTQWIVQDLSGNDRHDQD
jgi:anti-sigma factor RsiW